MVGGELPPPRNGAMKIELRNVKHSAALSEETAHFLAEIWIDGEEAGTARNQGTGGATRILPHHLGERLESYARSLLLNTMPIDEAVELVMRLEAEGP
jgi:hypothetical protein